LTRQFYTQEINFGAYDQQNEEPSMSQPTDSGFGRIEGTTPTQASPDSSFGRIAISPVQAPMGRTAPNTVASTTSDLEPAAKPKSRKHKLEFTGSSAEYFRIWIVNVMLSIVTLGVYAAWAKVRTRQYFYANTRLGGHAFEYHGNPISILKGNLVIAVLAVLYVSSQTVMPFLTPVLALLGFAAFPFLIHQSLRFMASNSSYRNIRFRFHGTMGESYTNHMLRPILTNVTLGFMAPAMLKGQREYLFDNAAYGSSRARFTGDYSVFSSIFWRSVGLSILMMIPLGILFAMMIPGIARGGDPSASLAGMFMILPIYAITFFGGTLIQTYMQVNLVNHCWNNTSVDGRRLRFVSSLDTMEMIKLRITNMLAIGLTLGLASPWAKVRYVQYVISGLSVFGEDDLENFAATERELEQSPLGDAATDFMNVDFGL
jgi:uncharacterized membrane protein YjgN (DUF898 family)